MPIVLGVALIGLPVSLVESVFPENPFAMAILTAKTLQMRMTRTATIMFLVTRQMNFSAKNTANAFQRLNCKTVIQIVQVEKMKNWCHW